MLPGVKFRFADCTVGEVSLFSSFDPKTIETTGENG